MLAITGANGFVGRHVVRELLRTRPPSAVRGLVLDEARARTELGRHEIPLRVADVRDAASLSGVFDGCEAIVHTVAIATERRGRFDEVNVRGVENVIAEARRAGVRRIVHLSAVGAAPDSPYPFLRSKGRGQRLIETSTIPFVVLRPSLLFGPGDDFFPRVAFTLRFPIVPVPGDGRARFQPIHVEDVAACVLAALERAELVGRAYEIGGPDPVTYDELLGEAMAALGVRRPRLHLPVPFVKPAAFALGIVLADPPVTVAQLDLLAVPNVPQPNEVARFGVRPRPFRGGLGYLRSA